MTGRWLLLVVAMAALGAAFVSRELPLILAALFSLVVAVARCQGVFDR